MGGQHIPAPSPIPSATDFEVLRRADEGLGKQVASISITRLAILLIIAVLFAGGIRRQDEQGTRDIIQSIFALAQSQGVTPSAHALDPITMYLQKPTWQTSDNAVSSQLDDLTTKLRTKYYETFRVKFAFLGTDITFDLRAIIVSFPLWLPIAQIYLSILREKRRLIRIIGAHLSQQLTANQITRLDVLLFGIDEGAYRSYPSILIDFLFWVVLTVLIGAIIEITSIATLLGNRDVIKLTAAVIFLSIFYSFAYSSLVSSRLRNQVETTLGYVVPEDRFGLWWRKSNEWIRCLPSRVKPRMPLAVSSFLILLTLLLQSAQVGCGHGSHHDSRPPWLIHISQLTSSPAPADDCRPGYQLLTGEADWPFSIGIFGSVNSIENFYGRTIYSILLAIAVFTLGLVVYSLLGKATSLRLLYILSVSSAAISIAFCCEFADVGLEFIIGQWWWLCPVGLIYGLWFFGARRSSPRWTKIRRYMRMGFVSILAADAIFLLSVATEMIGLLVLFVAVHLMTLGYFSARLHSQRECGYEKGWG